MWAGLGLLVVAACSESAGLFVDLRSDVRPGIEFSTVRTEIIGGTSSAGTPDKMIDREVSTEDDCAAGLRIAEFPDLDRGAWMIRVTLLVGESPIQQRLVALDHRASETVQVVITRNCRDVTCAADQTCVAGVCRAVLCGGGPDGCFVNECADDGDCVAESQLECVTRRCIEGICYANETPNTCPEGEWCRPEFGCVPVAVDPPPPPYRIAYRLVDSDSVTLDWSSGRQSTAGFQIAYEQGSEPPEDCASGTIVPLSAIGGTVHTIDGLLPNHEYSFRVCAVSSSTEFDTTDGSTVNLRTLPTCDVRAGPGDVDTDGDGTDSFAEFQAYLDDLATQGDPSGDGRITVCLGDGLHVVNNDALANDRIEIPANGFVLYAEADNAVVFRNERRSSAPSGALNGRALEALANSAFHAEGKTGLSFANLRLETVWSCGTGIQAVDGCTLDQIVGMSIHTEYPFAIGIDLVGSALRTLAWSNIAVGSGYGIVLGAVRVDGVIDENRNSFIDRIEGVSVAGGGASAVVIELRSSVRTISKSAIFSWNDNGLTLRNYNPKVDLVTESWIGSGGGVDSNGAVLLYGASVGFISSTSLVAADGATSGLYLSLNSHVGAMDGVELRRSTAGSGPGVAIVVDKYDWLNPADYFESSAITNVTACAETGTSRWEDGPGALIADLTRRHPEGSVVARTVPSTHNPHDGPDSTAYGVQTFPFAPGLPLGAQEGFDGIVLGGDCVLPNPEGLRATADGDGQITLRWSSGGGPTAGFRIAYQQNSVAPPSCYHGAQIPEDDVNGAEHVITGLEPAKEYSFRVCAADAFAAGARISFGATVSAHVF